MQRAERTDPDCAAYFARLFGHYIVPVKHLQTPGWFAAYLRRRVAVAAEPLIHAFPETNDPSSWEGMLHEGK